MQVDDILTQLRLRLNTAQHKFSQGVGFDHIEAKLHCVKRQRQFTLPE